MTALYYGQRPLLKVMTALICRLGQLKNYIIVDKWLGICVTIEGKIRKKKLNIEIKTFRNYLAENCLN